MVHPLPHGQSGRAYFFACLILQPGRPVGRWSVLRLAFAPDDHPPSGPREDKDHQRLHGCRTILVGFFKPRTLSPAGLSTGGRRVNMLKEHPMRVMSTLEEADVTWDTKKEGFLMPARLFFEGQVQWEEGIARCIHFFLTSYCLSRPICAHSLP